MLTIAPGRLALATARAHHAPEWPQLSARVNGVFEERLASAERELPVQFDRITQLPSGTV
jgi:hypothetical protein